MPLLTASLLAFSLSMPDAEPRVLHEHRVTSWGKPELDETVARVWRPGSKITLWPVACEAPPPKVDFHATFSPPAEEAHGSERCVAAKLHLPDEAVTDDGQPAALFLKRLAKCWKTTTERAPDDIVRGLEDGSVDVMQVLAARKTPTVLVIARRYVEGGHATFSVEAVAGPGPTSEDGSVPGMPTLMADYTVAIVDAPRALDVKREIRAGRFASAVTIARAGAKAAKGKSTEGRALANLAVAAFIARDAKAVPLEVQWRDDDTWTDADYRAQDSWSVAVSWARGEIELVADPCE